MNKTLEANITAKIDALLEEFAKLGDEDRISALEELIERANDDREEVVLSHDDDDDDDED
jgi:hypothetical protein